MAEKILETRIASLERQVRHFVNWQQTLTSILTSALPSADGFPAHAQSTGHLAAPVAGVKIIGGPLTPAATPPLRSTSPVLKSDTSSDFEDDKVELKKLSAELPASFETTVTVQEIPLTPIATPKRSNSPVNEKISLSISSEATIVPGRASTEVAFRILDVIQSYGQNLGDEEASKTEKQWLGRAKFAPKVEQHVEAGQPIRMILPSFPWKSVCAIAI